MKTKLLYVLAITTWFAACSEDPVSIGSDPGGSTASHLDVVPAASDTLFQEEIPLIAAAQLWVGQLNDYSVTTRSLLQFFEFDETAGWITSDTLTLDSVSLSISHRTDGLGSFQQEAHSQLLLHRADLNCTDCADLNELVYSSMYDEEDLPLYTSLDTLLLEGISSTDTLTRTLLPLEWLFETETTVFRDTVNLLLEMDYLSDADTSGFGYMHTYNAKADDQDDWPRLEFYYHSDSGDQDTLIEYVRYDTYLLRDEAEPTDGDLMISAGDSWQFALRFQDVDYHWEDGVRTDTQHSLISETIHAAYLHLYPQYTTETPLRFGEAPSTQVWDLLTWDEAGDLEIDTLVAQTSFTEGAGEQYVEINVTRLVNRWLTRDEYLGMLLRISQASENLNPVRTVYHSLADSTGRAPELLIYRSECPF